MRALVALLLTLLLVALVSACDTGEAGCEVPSEVEAGRLAVCLSGAVGLAADAETTAPYRDGTRMAFSVMGEGILGAVTLSMGPSAEPGAYQIWKVLPDGQYVGALRLTVDVPGTFDAFTGQSGTVTVESVGADGALAGTMDVAARSASGDLRIEGRFRTLPL